MDLVIDNRSGFDGREYLSGEWAPAISYAGHAPMWLARQHLFPDWETNSDLIPEMRDGESIWVKDPANPFNADGNLILQSIQRNAHIEIIHEYQILNVPGGLAQGLTPSGGATPEMAMILGDGFAFQHTLIFRNISNEALEEFYFYHLLHSLQASYSVYDGTDHGGPMADYRFDFTQRGDSYSLNTENGGVYRHSDYVTVHSRVEPDAFSVGYYGVRGTDVHDIGKPATGVHLDIETNTFSGLAEFEPPEGGWVAGAARYSLGTIGVNESVEFSLLLSLRTMSEMVYPDSGIVVERPMIEDGELKLYVQDQRNLFNEVGLGFGLESSTTMQQDTWTSLGIPFISNPNDPGRFSFTVPYDTNVPENYYRVQLIFASF